jgi:hypothetical protein
MLRIVALFFILVSGAALPAQADHDTRRGDWGSFLPPRDHHGPDRDHDGPPYRAPPVVADPVIGLGHHGRSLPNICLQAVETPDGWRRLYDQDCLSGRSAVYFDLPRDCRVRLVTWGDTRRGYDAQCLFDAGFRRES